MDRLTLGKMQNPIRGFLHGSAALATLIGVVLMLSRAWGNAAAITGVLVFGLALLFMYVVSSLYHSVPWGEKWKTRLQRIDHSMIYLVVAGTFAPRPRRQPQWRVSRDLYECHLGDRRHRHHPEVCPEGRKDLALNNPSDGDGLDCVGLAAPNPRPTRLDSGCPHRLRRTLLLDWSCGLQHEATCTSRSKLLVSRTVSRPGYRRQRVPLHRNLGLCHPGDGLTSQNAFHAAQLSVFRIRSLRNAASLKSRRKAPRSHQPRPGLRRSCFRGHRR